MARTTYKLYVITLIRISDEIPLQVVQVSGGFSNAGNCLFVLMSSFSRSICNQNLGNYVYN